MSSPQVILEEGHVVPADVRLICDYDTPENFERYKEFLLHEADDTLKEKEDEDEDEREHHVGHSIVAVDQSAITGESLAVSGHNFSLYSSQRKTFLSGKVGRILLAHINSFFTTIGRQIHGRYLLLHNRLQAWQSLRCGLGYRQALLRWKDSLVGSGS